MRKPGPVGAWDDVLQVALDLHRVLVAGEPEALREAANVRVDDDALGVAELG